MSWALVMGASSPIGGECAIRLAEEGYDVVVHYLRHEYQATQIVKTIDTLGRKTAMIRHRLDRQGDTLAFCNAVTSQIPSVDALVVASAAGVMRQVAELNEHHLNWTVQTSTIPLVVATSLLKPRGVVAISSLGATRVVNNYASIGIAKAALEAAIRYLAVEMAPSCRVNGVSVGLVRTGSALMLPDFEELEANTLSETPMQRLVNESDVANLVSFLLGERSKMITGAIIPLDGGYGLRW